MRPWERRTGLSMLPWTKMSRAWRATHPQEADELDRNLYENTLTQKRKKTIARNLARLRARKSQARARLTQIADSTS